jgi:hypothetical protein
MPCFLRTTASKLHLCFLGESVDYERFLPCSISFKSRVDKPPGGFVNYDTVAGRTGGSTVKYDAVMKCASQ